GGAAGRGRRRAARGDPGADAGARRRGGRPRHPVNRRAARARDPGIPASDDREHRARAEHGAAPRVRGARARLHRRGRMSTVAPAELVERIWARDSTVWTGTDEAKWLGWLDEPMRMRSRRDDLLRFVEDIAAPGVIDTFVLLGMGGSSLAPLVFGKTFGAESFHVLDTTHPAAIRIAAETLDLQRTLFIASSKSGSTLGTRSHLHHLRGNA